MSVDWEVQFGESLSESSSEGCSESSEASFCSASDFQSYDDSAEPIATEEEATQYAEQIAVEEEEEDMLLSRFVAGQIYQSGILFFLCFPILSALINVSTFVKRANFDHDSICVSLNWKCLHG